MLCLKAILLPSGDHAGWSCPAESKHVRFTCELPSAFMT